jgi:MFS family permease
VFYTMLGFLLKFPYVALRFYLRDTLLATPSQQAIVYAVVMGMPWNFKMVYGFISDTCPIRGRRRKPYMLMGTLTCSASWLLFGVWHFPDPPGMALMCFLLFWAVLGMIFADVMADALVVERMKGEKSDRKGGIQSTCWMLRFSGSITGFLLGGWLMEACFAPQSIFFMQGLVPLVTMLPPLFILDDPVVDGYEGRRRGGASSSSSRQIRGLSLGSMDGDNDRGDSARRSLADSGGGGAHPVPGTRLPDPARY